MAQRPPATPGDFLWIIAGLMLDMSLFIDLKLTNTITWPWLWVLSPIWIPMSIVGAGAGLFGFFLLISFVYKVILRSRRNRKRRTLSAKA